MKSDEVNRKLMSGLAWMALVRPANALSAFHSVETRATTSIMSLFLSTMSKKPSRRWMAFTSPRSPIRMQALYLPPLLLGLVDQELHGVAA